MRKFIIEPKIPISRTKTSRGGNFEADKVSNINTILITSGTPTRIPSIIRPAVLIG
jgi:hypothetical protein